MFKKFLVSLLFAGLMQLAALAQTPTPTPTDWKLVGKTGINTFGSAVYLYADNAVLIAVYYTGVFRSVDKGKTWNNISGLNQFGTHNILRVGSTLIAATRDGFFRSTDNGWTWTPGNGGLSQWGGKVTALSLTLMNGVVYAGASEFAGSPRCLRSTDGGLNWTRADTGLETVKEGWSITNLNGVLLLAERGSKLYRSTNGGASWTETSQGYEPAEKPIFATSHRHFFVAHSKGVYRSDNYGQTWTKILQKNIIANAAGLPSGNIAVRGHTLMVIASTGASGPPSTDIYYSKDYGTTWLQSYAPYAEGVGIINSHFAIAFANDRAFMIAVQGIYENYKILPPPLGVVSAASFNGSAVAPDSIAALFAGGLAPAAKAARTIPLPTNIDGTRLKLWDSTGAENYAPLFYVSGTQANFQVPPATPAGTVIVTAELNNAVVAEGQLTITPISASIFTANANGTGCPAGYFLRIRNNLPTNEAAVTLDAQNKFIARPLDLGPDTDQVFLILFGTGLRRITAINQVTATINGLTAEVTYAGAVNNLVGLDQINLRVPRALKGINRDADVVITVAGSQANTIKINIR